MGKHATMNDGGPAFPRTVKMHVTGSGEMDQDLTLSEGMSLRDYFAAKAMVAMVPKYAEDNGGVGEKHLNHNIPILAYQLADAMLEAQSQ